LSPSTVIVRSPAASTCTTRGAWPRARDVHVDAQLAQAGDGAVAERVVAERR
jgi:hypothetical protein